MPSASGTRPTGRTGTSASKATQGSPRGPTSPAPTRRGRALQRRGTGRFSGPSGTHTLNNDVGAQHAAPLLFSYVRVRFVEPILAWRTEHIHVDRTLQRVR